MSKLISGKEAKLAWANGIDVQLLIEEGDFSNFDDITRLDHLSVFDHAGNVYRLKPRTIMIGDVEVAAPFEPKEGEGCKCYYVNTTYRDGFDWYHSSHHTADRTAWRTEEEIKQVVAALRKLFKGE